MAKSKRNIGLEVLEGLREIKRGEYGRVINIPREYPREDRAFSSANCPTTWCFGSYSAGLGAGASSPLRCRKNLACYSEQESTCLARCGLTVAG
jgi:hypothetical protein